MAIREQEEFEVGIKWPNDLVIGNEENMWNLTEMRQRLIISTNKLNRSRNQCEYAVFSEELL